VIDHAHLHGLIQRTLELWPELIDRPALRRNQRSRGAGHSARN